MDRLEPRAGADLVGHVDQLVAVPGGGGQAGLQAQAFGEAAAQPNLVEGPLEQVVLAGGLGEAGLAQPG